MRHGLELIDGRTITEVYPNQEGDYFKIWIDNTQYRMSVKVLKECLQLLNFSKAKARVYEHLYPIDFRHHKEGMDINECG